MVAHSLSRVLCGYTVLACFRHSPTYFKVTVKQRVGLGTRRPQDVHKAPRSCIVSVQPHENGAWGKGVGGSTCVVTGESLCTFATPQITWLCRGTQQPHGRGGGKWNTHAHGITVAKSDARVAGWLQRRECHKPGAKPTCCSGAINEAIKANTTASQLLPSAGWKKVRGFVIETSSSGHFPASI